MSTIGLFPFGPFASLKSILPIFNFAVKNILVVINNINQSTHCKTIMGQHFKVRLKIEQKIPPLFVKGQKSESNQLLASSSLTLIEEKYS